MGVGSIVSRIVYLHVAAILVASIFMPLALYTVLRDAAEELHHRALSGQANEIAQYLHAEPGGSLVLSLPPSVRELYAESYGRYEFSVLDDGGRVAVSSAAEPAPKAAGPSGLSAVPHFFQYRRGEKLLYGADIPETVAGRRVWVQVSEDLQHRDVLIDDIVTDFFVDVGWVPIPILVVLLIIDIGIFWRALRPVVQASALAASIGPSRTDVRLPTAGMPREIVPLVQAVNAAFDRLEQGFRAQRDFTADAAHELRTPLAILRTHVDTLGDEAVARALRTDIAGMSRITNQLLEIAELETLVVAPEQRTDLSALCVEVAGFLAPLALAQGKQVAVTGADGAIWVEGDGETLFQALRNLAENAVAHTPLGSTVELRPSAPGSVDVLDRGPGVPVAARQQIFRRFWRADRRRPGSGGLGLAIVARIVEAHGGSIGVEDRAGGGAVFSLRLRPVGEVTARSDSVGNG
jgi:signal transduction histidine kinase